MGWGHVRRCVKQQRLNRCGSAGSLTEEPQPISDDHGPGKVTNAKLGVVMGSKLLNVRCVLAFPLGPSVLEPDLDLGLREV